MAKLIITSYGNGHIAALQEDSRITELHCCERIPYQVGDVFIARIQNIVKNLDAAFVTFGGDVNGYLDLSKVEHFLFTRQARPGKATIGDELVVQLSKEAVKTKLPVFSGQINLAGQCAVLIYGDQGINYSRKIYDQSWKADMQASLEEAKLVPENCGLILRTNAASLDKETVLTEIKTLASEADNLLKVAPYRSCNTRLIQAPHPFCRLVRDLPLDMELEVVTDDEELYAHLCRQLPEYQLRLFSDPYVTLTGLYGLESTIKEATGKHVWLKSGGYLVIEPTEALTVIDVNTGGSIESKDKEKHFLKVNLEAAKELALQMRLRNLSGIILVDFIDMKEDAMNQTLISTLKTELRKDRTKATFVDMTPLHLAEITRKRVTRPLHEAIKILQK